MTAGMVYLVGAGPGDPGLVTCRGLDAIRSAETIVYDHLVHRRLLDAASPTAKLVFVGKKRGHQEMPQEDINRLLCEEAESGRIVVRLKGGDPFVFGRGAEEAEALHAAGIPFRVVPGVTAGVGALAYAGLPVTHRDHASAVVFVTGHDDPDSLTCRVDWSWYARFQGTIVIYMGMTRRARIASVLIEHGMNPRTLVAMVERGAWTDQKSVETTLEELSDPTKQWPIKPPGLIMIGESVRLRPVLDWWSRLPLSGRTVVLTRPEDDARSTEIALEDLGARVLVAPTITVGPIEDAAALDDAIKTLERYDWLVFTSANGVRYFFERLFALGYDLRRVGHAKLAAIGPATAKALRKLALNADVVPNSYRSEDLAEALVPLVRGKRVLLARADRGRTVLKDELEGIAAEVTQIPVYRNADADGLPAEVLAALEADKVDWVTLTSSAIARRFEALRPRSDSGDCVRRLKFASISPVTSQAAREAGIEPTVEAEDYTINGVIQAIADFERRTNPDH
jgi:uroporphyrinogen III methyltransferase/synthase